MKPSHRPWPPHGYQRRAVQFLKERGAGALFLDPGLGKTAIVLKTFCDLQDAGVARRMLVVAPLRVCQLVWRQEAEQWSDFRHLTFSFIHGPKKEEALKADADVYLINPEGVPWLADRFFGRSRIPFDTVVIDELTKFKNHRAKRAKKLRPLMKHVARRWGLTGTPVPNGYMDLFGQMLMLDDGAALGKYITHFRDRYFQPDYTGFNYTLLPGAEKQIERRIKDYVLRMSAEDYLALPPLVDDVREVDMDKKSRKLYETMKKEMLVELGDDVVTAGNAAAVYSKLAQMANGAVYAGEADRRKWIHVHDAKLEAIEELVEELAGEPLLVGYEFKHDLDRLRAKFGEDTPYLGSGVSGKQAQDIERRWNAGEIPVLLVHPASAGHGLNFQRGGAAHICWFSVTWDLELYDQLIRRIFRQGNDAPRIVNHIIAVRDTIDHLKMIALDDKDNTQARLLQGLNAEILRDAGAPAAGSDAAPTTENDMVRKLKRRSRDAEPDDDYEDEDEQDAKPAKKGWGSKAKKSDDDGDEVDRDKVRERLRGRRKKAQDDEPDEADEDEDEDEEDEPVSRRAKRSFSKRVRDKLEDESDEEDEDEADAEEDEKPKRKPRRKVGRKISDTPEDRTDDEADEGKAETVSVIGGSSAAAEDNSRRYRREAIVSKLIENSAQFGLRSANDVLKAAEPLVKFVEDE